MYFKWEFPVLAFSVFGTTNSKKGKAQAALSVCQTGNLSADMLNYDYGGDKTFPFIKK